MKKEAIILVAGMGTRLKPLTENNHKCLTEVHGVPILINTLEILSQNNFSKVILVVGYLQELIRRRIGDSYRNMKIEYAVNEKYEQTNTSYSLKLGLDKYSGQSELFIFEGDVFFEEALLENFINMEEQNATVLEKYNTLLDGTFVTLDSSAIVAAWTHKSKRPKDYTLEDKYKTVNIHKFDNLFVKQILYPYVEKVVENTDGKEPLETVMDNIVRDGGKIAGFILSGQRWFEIDDLVDLQHAEKVFC